ncbi:hypothetical protein ACFWY5_47570 [Nonomuraea sp. NPDC059007]|uniref:hypothetical protein n=1 Tax=Nonomuraea sp. NPDC059007 TaxID=3346692 RepID=UPI00369CAF5F
MLRHPLPVLAGVVALVSAVLAAPAQAAFPGANGPIYFVDQTTDPDKEIYRINPDGGGLTKLTDNDVADSNAAANAGNTRVAFTRFAGGSHQLWTMNPDGTGQTQVDTGGPVVDAPVDWSPDGTKIIYRAGDSTLTVIGPDGSGRTSLGVYGDAPAWSPGGDRIAFRDPTRNISVMNADGSGETQLTAYSGNDGAGLPDWSPDGSKITYGWTRFAPNLAQIYVMNADGSGQANLSNDATFSGAPRWSPDGTKIAYTSDNDLFTMNTDGTGKSALAVVPGFQFTIDWAPAGATDVAVDLAAQPRLGLLVPYLSYRMTARNAGPGPLTSATLTATLPPGRTATHLSPGCTSVPGTVTCSYTALAAGASATATFRLPLGLLSLGNVTVTATRTASSPADPDPANDSDAAPCTVVTVLLATCA